jgi:hypothetical protein
MPDRALVGEPIAAVRCALRAVVKSPVLAIASVAYRHDGDAFRGVCGGLLGRVLGYPNGPLVPRVLLGCVVLMAGVGVDRVRYGWGCWLGTVSLAERRVGR